MAAAADDANAVLMPFLLLLLQIFHASCITCDPGQFVSENNECTQCKPGFHISFADHQQRACLPCQPGEYAPLPGFAECWRCPSGSSSGIASSSCTIALKCDPCIDRTQVKIRAVVHGQSSDPFWLRVKRAMETAAGQMKVDFALQLQLRKSQSAMADTITQTVAKEKPDILLVTVPGPGVHAAIMEAAQNVLVFSLNSGAHVFQKVGSKAHFAMDEYLGGFQSVARFVAAFDAEGSQLSVCIALSPGGGNSAFAQRAAGYADGCKEKGLSVLPTVVLDDVSMYKSVVERIIVGYLDSAQAPSGGLGLLLLSSRLVSESVAAYGVSGTPSSKVKIGAFDLDENVYRGLDTGDILFGIDQKEWLQGYLPIVVSTLYHTTGNMMAPLSYPTGPSFVTTAPSAQQAERASESFPVCNCPWRNGVEDSVDCSGAEAFGTTCPLEMGSCQMACKDGRRFKLASVTHGYESDAFWFVLKAGAEQAANDLRLVGFEADLFGPPASSRSDAFSQDLFAQTITDVADRPEVDAMLVSIPFASVQGPITYAAGKKIVVSINSGYDVAESLNPLGGGLIAHVGMHEKNAGRGAGRFLQEAGAQHLVCLMHEKDNSVTIDRCSGAKESMEQAGKRMTILSLADAGIAYDDEDSAVSFLTKALQEDGSIDAILCTGPALVPTIMMALRTTGKARGSFWAGSFDVSLELVRAIDAGEYFLFGVDQQQYLQGYMSVLIAWIYHVTGHKLPSFVLETGPFFVLGSEPTKDKCMNLKWQNATKVENSIVGVNLLPHHDAALTTGFPVCQFKPPQKCRAGFELNAENDCVKCAPGYAKAAQEQGNMEPCIACAPGTFAAGYGSQRCDECGVGTFQNASGRSVCDFCNKGSFTRTSKKTECDVCEMGTYQSKSRSSACLGCESGKFMAGRGASSCRRCHFGRTTPALGSTSAAYCLCDEGKYSTDPSSPCLDCPKGMTCNMGSDMMNWANKSAGLLVSSMPGVPLEYPKQVAMFWAYPADPTNVFLCRMKSHCPAGDPGTCGVNMRGMVCGLCAEKHYFDGDKCIECEDTVTSRVLFPTTPIIIGCPFVALLYKFSRDSVEDWSSNGNALACLFYLTLVYVQTIAVVSEVFWFDGQSLRATMGWSAYTFAPISLLRPACAGFADFEAGFVLQAFLPLYPIPIFLLTYIASQRLQRVKLDMDPDVTYNCYLSVFNTFYVGIVQQCLSLFQCYEHPNGESSLRSASHILCGSDTWRDMLAFAVISVVVFCLGFGVLLIYVVFKAPARFSNETFRKRYKFLFIKFRPSCYMWSFLMLFKGLLFSMTSVIFRNGFSQVVFLHSVIVVYLCITFIFLPWRSFAISCLDAAMHTCLTISFIFLPRLTNPDDASLDEHVMAYATVCLLPLLCSAATLVILLRMRFLAEDRRKFRHAMTTEIVRAFHLANQSGKLADLLDRMNTADALALMQAAIILRAELACERPVVQNKRDLFSMSHSPFRLNSMGFELQPTVTSKATADSQPFFGAQPAAPRKAPSDEECDESDQLATDAPVVKPEGLRSAGLAKNRSENVGADKLEDEVVGKIAQRIAPNTASGARRM